MYPAEAGHSRPPGTVDTQWTPTRSVRDERYATREAVELFRICHHARWKPGTVGTQWTPTRSLAPSRGGGEGWQEVTKVLLGASGLLSNGHVISRVMIILLYYYSTIIVVRLYDYCSGRRACSPTATSSPGCRAPRVSNARAKRARKGRVICRAPRPRATRERRRPRKHARGPHARARKGRVARGCAGAKGRGRMGWWGGVQGRGVGVWGG